MNGLLFCKNTLIYRELPSYKMSRNPRHSQKSSAPTRSPQGLQPSNHNAIQAGITRSRSRSRSAARLSRYQMGSTLLAPGTYFPDMGGEFSSDASMSSPHYSHALGSGSSLDGYPGSYVSSSMSQGSVNTLYTDTNCTLIPPTMRRPGRVKLQVDKMSEPLNSMPAFAH